MKTSKAYSRRIDAFDEALRNYARLNAYMYAQSRACTILAKLKELFSEAASYASFEAQISAVKRYPELFPDSAAGIKALRKDFFADRLESLKDLAMSELMSADTSLCMASLAKKAEPNVKAFCGRFVEKYYKKRTEVNNKR